MTICELRAADIEPLADMFERLPRSDLTFIKEDTAPDAVGSWLEAPGWRWVAREEDGTVHGLVALIPLAGWSDHVGELRLVVDPAARGKGTGRALANTAVQAAVRHDLKKIVVEVPADHEPVIEMFVRLGFSGEALLRDHFRDRDGNLRDLVMLAYLTDQLFDTMTAMGVADAL